MLKRTLIAIAALALLALPAIAVPPPPQGGGPFLAQAEIPVVMKIDRFVQITVGLQGGPRHIELHEKPNRWWEGSVPVNIINNWSVRITATIEPFLPNISPRNDFQVHIEGSGRPFGAGGGQNVDALNLHPYKAPEGYNFRVWAGIHNPDLTVRAHNVNLQRVATVYLTVQN